METNIQTNGSNRSTWLAVGSLAAALLHPARRGGRGRRGQGWVGPQMPTTPREPESER